MCGICGYVSRNEISEQSLISMRDKMNHRGPNDAGIWQSHSGVGYVGLAHRRLSIFDLSLLGHQPMISENADYVIVYNGEIYNFKEIRKRLSELGYHFKSECDTEVILYAYIEWNENCFEMLNGMFAIAIWDVKNDSLTLARDRMGVKPLYYYWNPVNGDFVFASELKSIMSYPRFKKDIRNEAIGEYLCNKYIASPNTIFENTYKLQPGRYLEYDGRRAVVNIYWDILEQKKTMSACPEPSLGVNKQELKNLLTDSVAKRLAADVPVGVFLSGGIDSALVSAISQQISDRPIQTFTIGFHEKERNEANEARRIAEYLGTDHTELYVGEKEILEMLDDIEYYYDEPFSDSSQLPTMLVSRLAAEKVTVALSGDGGDELFCGYKMYDLVKIAQLADPLGAFLRKTGLGSLISNQVPTELRAFIRNDRKGLKTQLFTDVKTEIVKDLLGDISFEPKYDLEERLDYSNWQERRMLLDMMTYLPDEVMAKTDRASMKYSLEVRSPLLDHRVVERSFRVPHNQKYCLTNKKYILKQLAYDYIPRELLNGPKRGFGVPLAKWLRGPLHQEILRVTNKEYIERQGIFDIGAVERLLNKQLISDSVIYSSIIWSILIFQKWWEKYIEI